MLIRNEAKGRAESQETKRRERQEYRTSVGVLDLQARAGQPKDGHGREFRWLCAWRQLQSSDPWMRCLWETFRQSSEGETKRLHSQMWCVRRSGEGELKKENTAQKTCRSWK